MSELFMWMYCFDKITIILYTLSILLGIYCLCILILYIMTKIEDGNEKALQFSKTSKLLFSLVIFSILTPLSIISPTKKDILIYASLKTVDTYNEQNENSNLKVENALELIDKTISRVDSFINKE